MFCSGKGVSWRGELHKESAKEADGEAICPAREKREICADECGDDKTAERRATRHRKKSQRCVVPQESHEQLRTGCSGSADGTSGNGYLVKRREKERELSILMEST